MKLDLSDEMVNIIGLALGEIPFKIARPVVIELQKQINSQQPNGTKMVTDPTPPALAT